MKKTIRNHIEDWSERKLLKQTHRRYKGDAIHSSAQKRLATEYQIKNKKGSSVSNVQFFITR